MAKVLSMGSDHRGVGLKAALREKLESLGYEVRDFGPESDEKGVDYPDHAAPAARAVADGDAALGIVVCGTGLGVMYTANRFPGVRCALVGDVEMAELARQHNDANMLALSGNRLDFDAAWPIVEAWLNTPFEGGRHQGRVDKIDELTRP